MSDQFAYVDLELIVQKAGKNEFHVRAKSDTGEGEVTVPIKPELKQALHSFGGESSAPIAKQMRKWGADLFEQAIRGDVLYTYQKCRDQARMQGKKGVRWRLTLDHDAEELPWDFLRSERNFLAVDPSNPVVRYIKSATCERVSVEHPLQLLVVIASPTDFEPLDAAAEKERIKISLEPLLARGQVNISYIEGPNTWSRLQDTLLQEKIHMLHFIGHGNFDEDSSQLVMEDDCGKSDLRESEDLAVLALDRPLQLVVLNSCFGAKRDDTQKFSSVAASMVRSGVPAVIAMRTEISDDAARAISQTFYTALALNMPVDAALTEARRKIFRSDSLEWATPILYMQVPDGQLFRFGAQVENTSSWQVDEIIDKGLDKGKNWWEQGLNYFDQKKKEWAGSRLAPKVKPRQLPPPIPPSPPQQVTVATSEQRLYLMEKGELTPLANALQQCFTAHQLGSGKKNLDNGSLLITGGRTPSDLVGSVKLEQDEKGLSVTLLGDRSAVRQQRLFDALWRTIESFVASCGGRPAPPNQNS
jgi:CHAT domain